MNLLALAFTAGMLAPVNPCGFALLPAWITGTIATGGTDAVLVRLARALRTGAVLTIGFTGTLTLAGIAISAGARTLVTAAPWLGITIGLTLAILGGFMLTGRTIGLRMPARTRHRPDSPTAGGVLAAGIGYALASLSCTFGVLLAVIAQAQATSGWGGLLAVFTAYTAGAATILMLVSVGTAIAGTALTRHLGILARHGTRVTAVCPHRHRRLPRVVLAARGHRAHRQRRQPAHRLVGHRDRMAAGPRPPGQRHCRLRCGGQRGGRVTGPPTAGQSPASSAAGDDSPADTPSQIPLSLTIRKPIDTTVGHSQMHTTSALLIRHIQDCRPLSATRQFCAV